MKKIFAPWCLSVKLDICDLIPRAGSLDYDGFMYSIKEAQIIGVGKLQNLCRQHGVHDSIYYHRINIDSNNAQFDKQLNWIDQYAKIASQIGSELTVLSITPGSNNQPYDLNLQQHVNRLSRIATILEKYNIVLGIEFLAKSPGMEKYRYRFIRSLQELLELTNRIQSRNLKLVLDAYHLYHSGELYKFDTMVSADNIVLLQICDIYPASCYNDLLKDDRRLPMKCGVIDARRFISVAASMGFKEYVLIETFHSEVNDQIQGTLIQARDALERCLS